MNGRNIINHYIINGNVYSSVQLTAGQTKTIEQAAVKEKYAVLRKNLADQYGDTFTIKIKEKQTRKEKPLEIL